MHNFGSLDRQTVTLAVIADQGIEAEVISYGAALRALRIATPRGPVEVTLGYDDLDGYVTGKGYVGAIVGRYANRIGGARFTLDGKAHELAANEGENQLHGGPEGFSHRNWRMEAASAGKLTLALTSPDGDMGFPGRLDATVNYEIVAPMTLRITIEATADRPTPANLVSHAYFNLDGGGDARDHILALGANRFVEVDAGLIPTGALRDVTGTPFDFRTPRTLRSGGVDYDLNYCLDRAGPGLVHGATLTGGRSGITMEVWTSEPGIQLYDGEFLTGRFAPHAGLCLECQRWPDSPNQPRFPTVTVPAGGTKVQAMEWRFTA